MLNTNNNINMNTNFELMLSNYLSESDDNLKHLNKRSTKKAGRLKNRCNKGIYILTINND